MNKATRAVAAGAIAALLAACSGTGNTPVASSNNSSANSSSVSIPRAVQDRSGNVRVMFYTVAVERSGMVGGFQDAKGGFRQPLARRTSNLTYHNGPIQTAPAMYLVFWGSGWSSDPSGEKTYYQNFLKGIGGSAWLSSVTQYTQSNGQHVGNSAGSFIESITDASTLPNLNTSSYQSAFAAEAAKIAGQVGNYSANASYILAVPHGVPVYQFAGNFSGLSGYCAWHSSTSASGGRIAYTNFPYQSDAGASCGENSVNSNGTEDGVSIVGGHEQAETETDPQPNTGWLDSSGAENGDKCAWKNLANEPFSTGTFPTQPLWSNSAGGCVQ